MIKAKILSFILTAALIFGCTIQAAGLEVPDSEPPVITVQSADGAPGTEITLDITLSGNPGIVAAYLDVYYTVGLTLVKAESTELLNDPFFGNDYSANPFALNWEDAAADENNSQNGVIARLTFLIPENAPLDSEYDISVGWDSGDIFNSGTDDCDFTPVNGKITVQERLETGDVDGNGSVNIIDSLIVLCASVHKIELTDRQIIAADIDNDGKITSLDALMLLLRAVRAA